MENLISYMLLSIVVKLWLQRFLLEFSIFTTDYIKTSLSYPYRPMLIRAKLNINDNLH